MRSAEDHGYVLDLGLSEVSGFLSYDNAKGIENNRRSVGSLINVVVEKVSEDGRTCILKADDDAFRDALVRIHGILTFLICITELNMLAYGNHEHFFASSGRPSTKSRHFVCSFWTCAADSGLF